MATRRRSTKRDPLVIGIMAASLLVEVASHIGAPAQPPPVVVVIATATPPSPQCAHPPSPSPHPSGHNAVP
jgi:hypothetical protein